MNKQLITFTQNGENLVCKQEIESPMGGIYLPKIKYFETKKTSGSGGTKIKLFKGFRIGFGQTKSRDELINIEEGYLDISNKNITFCGQSITIQIPILKIIRFQPYTDGIGICKTGRQKEYRFVWRKDINMKLIDVKSDDGTIKPLNGGVITAFLNALKKNP